MGRVFFSIGGATVRANHGFVIYRQGQSCSSQAVRGGGGKEGGSYILHHHVALYTALQLSEGHTYRVTGNSTVGLCGSGQMLPLFEWVYNSVPYV